MPVKPGLLRKGKPATMFRGLNYQVDSRLIQIFGFEGMKLYNGVWFRSDSHGSPKEVNPCNCTTDQMYSSITEIVESGQSDKIARLQLGSHEAVTLFLKGLLTISQFGRAYEEPNSIILPEVKIPGGLWRSIPVHISRQKHCLAFLDKEGRAITIPVDSDVEESMPDLTDEIVNQTGGELVFSILNYGIGNLEPSDRGEDDTIAAFERRFAVA